MKFIYLRKESRIKRKRKIIAIRQTDSGKETENVRGRRRGVLSWQRGCWFLSIVLDTFRIGSTKTTVQIAWQHKPPFSKTSWFSRKDFFYELLSGVDFAISTNAYPISKMVSTERTAMIIFGLALFVTSGERVCTKYPSEKSIKKSSKKRLFSLNEKE